MKTNRQTRKAKPMPPGSGANKDIARMLRNDHAGETAAVGIYHGQKAVFSSLAHKQELAEKFSQMQADEQVHLDAFSDQLLQRGERPTAMIGIWSGMSYALGVGTALLGERAAHACTEAVESVIEKHYQEQIDELDNGHDQPELREMFVQFREDELGRRDHAIDHGAKDAPGYPLLSAIITLGCKAAIKISSKV